MWYRRVIGGDRCPIVDTWWQTETGAIMVIAAAGRDGHQAGLGDGSAARHRRSTSSTARAVRRRGRRRLPDAVRAVAVDAARHLGRRGALPGHLLVALRGAVLRRRRRQVGRRARAVAARPRRRRHERQRPPHLDDRGRVGAGVAPEGRRGRGRRRGRPDDRSGDRRVRDGQGRRHRRRLATTRSCRSCATTSPRRSARSPSRARSSCRPSCPKTRSGKIMRRLLVDIAERRELGDVTTLADPAVVQADRRDDGRARRRGLTRLPIPVPRLPRRSAGVAPGSGCGRQPCGLRTTFTTPSSFFWKESYSAGASSSGAEWVWNDVDAERVLVGQQRQDVGRPALDVALAHPQLHLLVEQREHRQRVGHAAVHAGQRDGPAAAHQVDRAVQGAEPVDAGLLEERRGHDVGQQTGHLLRELRDGRAVRLQADRVDDRVRSAPSVRSRTTSPRSFSWLGQVDAPRSPRTRRPARSRSGTRSTPITRNALVRRRSGRLMSPIGPSPSTTTVPPSGTAAYSTACQAVGSTSDR